MGIFLLDGKGSTQRKVYEKILSQFLSQPVDAWTNTFLTADNVHYMLVLSLFLQTSEEWRDTKIIYLKKIIAQTTVLL